MIQTNLKDLISDTEGQADHILANHVYVCCHPNQQAQLYPFVRQLILPHGATFVLWSYQNSANMLSNDVEKELCDAIKQMRLMVLLVTKRFLYEPNRGRDVEFAAARECGVPILPILVESGMEVDFNEFSDGLQALIPGSVDDTEVSFEQKVTFALQKIFLVQKFDQHRQRGFRARAFLSYRKKDRRYANALMQFIHNTPGMESVSIWYDEFLPAGEGFQEEIKKQMEDSDVVLLMITPSILEKGNYVLEVEYLMAWQLKKPIIPVVVADTDLEQIRHTYTGMPEIIDVRQNNPFLHEALNQALIIGRERQGLTWDLTQELSAEQLYHLAECYLVGYHVEQDAKRALSLFQKASRMGNENATERLVTIYSRGLCGKPDMERAIAVQEQYVAQKSAQATNLYSLGDLNAEVKILTELYGAAGLYEQGYEASRTMYEFVVDYVRATGDGQAQLYLPAIQVRMAKMLVETGRYQEACTWAEAALQPLLDANEVYLQAKQSSGSQMEQILDCFHTLMLASHKGGDNEAARRYAAQLINYQVKVDRAIPGMNTMLGAYGDYLFLGERWAEEADYESAIRCFSAAGGLLDRASEAGFMSAGSNAAQVLFEALVHIDVRIAEVFLVLQNHQEAVRFFESAMNRIQKRPNHIQLTEELREEAEKVKKGVQYLRQFGE